MKNFICDWLIRHAIENHLVLIGVIDQVQGLVGGVLVCLGLFKGANTTRGRSTTYMLMLSSSFHHFISKNIFN
jgi:hypothetical protein